MPYDILDGSIVDTVRELVGSERHCVHRLLAHLRRLFLRLSADHHRHRHPRCTALRLRPPPAQADGREGRERAARIRRHATRLHGLPHAGDRSCMRDFTHFMGTHLVTPRQQCFRRFCGRRGDCCWRARPLMQVRYAYVSRTLWQICLRTMIFSIAMAELSIQR